MEKLFTVTCETTDRSQVSVSFNANDFFDWFRKKNTIIYGKDEIEPYLIDYLNAVEYHAFFIDGEETTGITSDLKKVLGNDFISEFELIYDMIKYNI